MPEDIWQLYRQTKGFSKAIGFAMRSGSTNWLLSLVCKFQDRSSQQFWCLEKENFDLTLQTLKYSGMSKIFEVGGCMVTSRHLHLLLSRSKTST